MKKVSLLACALLVGVSAVAADYQLTQICDGGGGLTSTPEELAKVYPTVDCDAISKSRGGNIDDIDAIQDGIGSISVAPLGQPKSTDLQKTSNDGLVSLINQFGSDAKEAGTPVVAYAQDVGGVNLSADGIDGIPQTEQPQDGGEVDNSEIVDGVEYAEGHTEPPSGEPLNDCEDGFTTEYADDDGIECDDAGLSTLAAGYLNISSALGGIDLSENNLSNLDNLGNLTRVGSLSLSENPLTNIDGLRNLKRIEYGMYLDSDAEITNVNGLRNLQYTGSLSLNNVSSLTDVSGLKNVSEISSASNNYISFAAKEYSVKLPSDSYICTTAVFTTKVRFFGTDNSGVTNYEKICEGQPPLD